MSGLPEAWRYALVVAAVSLVLSLPGLGEGPFVGDDEALDAGVVREMAEHGEWLFPEFNAEYLPPKPPLFYWAAAAVTRLAAFDYDGGEFDFDPAGEGEARLSGDEPLSRPDFEWTVRLPSALFGAGTAALTVTAGAPLVGARPAALGGLLLSAMPVFHGEARTGRADMTMTFFVAACLFLARLAPEPMPRRHRWLFFSLLGLLLLAKGAAGVGLVAAVLAVEAVRGERRAALRSLLDPAVVAFLVVGGTWFLLGSLHWGRIFVEKHVIGENLRHFFGGLVSTDEPTRPFRHHLSHFVNVFTASAPWGFLLPPALRDGWLGASGGSVGDLPDGRRFLCVWLAAGFVFFTVATRKSPYYLLPLLPPLALLVGAWLHPRLPADPFAPLLRVSRGAALGGLAAAVVIVAVAAALREVAAVGPEIRAMASAAGDRPFLFVTALAALTPLSLVAARALRQRDIGAAAAPLMGVSVVFLVLGSRTHAQLAQATSLERFAEAVERAAGPDDRIFFHRRPLPAIALYAERRIPTLREGNPPGPGDFLLIVPDSLAGLVPPEWRQRSETLVRDEARVFTRRVMGIELIRVTREPGAPEGPPSSEEVRHHAASRNSRDGVFP